ncbi:hypothetical protein KSF_044160 [Reticulibacter mediterranei]|uniref:Peptidase C51 domain-containing protein n=1 Tax=Reticulibacter mediterranei TaxID=2778369 RepID=A0A8J3IIQ1_9CHLR|nr:CHAP domain-containing protein [Reticulibacter mediterranei]GHO94368.1 hypothetical protein KSF_044160 [Reticulibacter mediterranei]
MLKQKVAASILLALVVLALVLFLAARGSTAARQSTATSSVAPQPVSSPTWVDRQKKQGFRSQSQYIAAEAIIMARNLYGKQANQYYADAATMKTAYAYWQRTCQHADGSLCEAAKSGNLQCVTFLAGVFASIDDELPYVGDANRFWDLYQHKEGWQEIAPGAIQTSAPMLGDLVVASGGRAGHLAIIVDLKAPAKGQDGSITVAEANAPSAFEQLTWHANGQVDVWSGYRFQGLIRQQEIAPCLRQQATPTQQQWAALAMEVAVHYGTPEKYFLRQICQSGFQISDARGHALISSSGGIGIAQLPANIARNIPRCVTNFVQNAQNCDQRVGSLPTGVGIDPTVPAQALPAAAYTMSILYNHYRQNPLVQTAQDTLAAYTMALAAYNAGPSVVDNAVNTCGSVKTAGWLSCLDHQQADHHTRDYIRAVLGEKA